MYLLKCGAPCRPGVIVRWSFASKRIYEDVLFHSILPRDERPKDVRLRKAIVSRGGGYRRISLNYQVVKKRALPLPCTVALVATNVAMDSRRMLR